LDADGDGSPTKEEHERGASTGVTTQDQLNTAARSTSSQVARRPGGQQASKPASQQATYVKLVCQCRLRAIVIIFCLSLSLSLSLYMYIYIYIYIVICGSMKIPEGVRTGFGDDMVHVYDYVYIHTYIRTCIPTYMSAYIPVALPRNFCRRCAEVARNITRGEEWAGRYRGGV